MQRKQAQKAELASLIFGKGAALVEQSVVQEDFASQIGFD
jgi:hypothetical protein